MRLSGSLLSGKFRLCLSQTAAFMSLSLSSRKIQQINVHCSTVVKLRSDWLTWSWRTKHTGRHIQIIRDRVWINERNTYMNTTKKE